MSETLPKVAARKPAVLTLDPGTYWWCACGLSDNEPYCDGAHKGSDMTPVQFDIDQRKQVALCLCKQTGNPPYCDGAHARLD